MGWCAAPACAVALACGPVADDSGDDGGVEVTLVRGNYDFDSGCTPYEQMSLLLAITAADVPIEEVVLESYSIDGFMSGTDRRVDPVESPLPIAPGTTAELRFRDSNDGWVDECADFEPPADPVVTEIVVVVDGESFARSGEASVGCGWTEC